MMWPTQARRYQINGAEFAAPRRVAYIGDDMGVGKTIQAIGAINIIGALRVLVVCPASGKINWTRELEKWLQIPLAIGIVSGKDSRAYKNADVVVINYDLCNRYKGLLRSIHWDVVVYDEAHYLKNWETQRTKALLAHGGLNADHHIFMSGTPILSRPIELWPILYGTGLTKLSYHDYGLRFCNGHKKKFWKKDKYDKPVLTEKWDYKGATNTLELHECLKKVMIRRLKKEVLTELPAKTHQVLEIEAGPIPGGLKSLTEVKKIDISKMSAESLIDGLRKVAPAIEYIKDCLEEEDKVVVFAWHKEVVRFIRNAFPGSVTITGDDSVKASQRACDSFQNDPDCRVIVGNHISMGTVHTLTAASHVIFVELVWDPGTMSQAIDRVHRMGQTMPVLVTYLVLNGSLDANKAQALVRKIKITEEVLNGQTGQ